MRGDGPRPSLWVADRPAATPPRGGKDRFDVVVVGAGITGLTAAVELTATGRRVLVLESRRLGSGATGFTTAKISALHGAKYRDLTEGHGRETAQAYATANQEALAWMLDRIEGHGIDCDLARRDAVTYVRDPKQVGDIEEEAAAAVAAGLDAVLTTDSDLPFPVAAAVVVRDQAQFDPLPYLRALRRDVEAGGGEVHELRRVHGLRAGSRDVEVATDTGSVRADHVLVCTGIPFVDRALFFAQLEPVRSYVIAVRTAGEPPRSMSISTDEPVRSLRTASGPGGAEVLLVGGESHVVGRRSPTTEAYTALERWATTEVGATETLSTWSTQDYVPPDGLPYVGTTRTLSDRVLVATGFAKWGMTNGTAAGRLLAATLAGRLPPWAPPFAAGRLNPRQSTRKIVTLNTEVAAHLVGDRLCRPVADEPDLRDGEGRVVRIRGRLRGIARVGDDVLSCNPVCPHLYGVLAWNDAEQSWDCPLHGSRFAVDGALLQGPAVDDLEVDRRAVPPT